MKKRIALVLLMLAVAAGAAFAQKVGDTGQFLGQDYRVTEASGNRLVLEKVASIPTFTSLDEFKTWIDGQPANTKDTAYAAKLNIASLQTFDLASILEVKKGKYVSLDFSGSTFTSMGGKSSNSNNTLTGIILPSRFTTFNWDAFKNYGSLTNITIPSGVTLIDVAAFQNCSSLASITIPASVTSISRDVFLGCPSLTSVTFQGTIPAEKIGNNPFIGDLRAKYLAGGRGTYIRTGTGNTSVWTKQ